MEKTKNKFYVACAVLEFVFASLEALSLMTMITGVATGTLYASFEADLIAQYGGQTAEMLAELELLKSATIVVIVALIAQVTVMYVVGSYFVKYSKMTDQEAADKWGRCMAWVIVSYFFGGLLVGGLATAGLCAVQNAQRHRVISGKADWTTSTGKTVDMATGQVSSQNVQEDVTAPEYLEKLGVKLEKLKALKDSGAITEQEYAVLREKTMQGVAPKKPEVVVDPEEEKLNKMTERLNKLSQLKESGAISEEEYNSLREKVINESK